MTTMNDVIAQFRQIGFKPSFIASGEIKELPNILLPGEELTHVVMGWYENGLALLCSTNHRVLLIDKKPFFLTVEDLRYNMIVEVRYQHRLLDANVCLHYPAKSLDFKSWNRGRLRQLVAYVQQSITETRQFGTPVYTNDQPAPEYGGVETLPVQNTANTSQQGQVMPSGPSPSQYYQAPQSSTAWPTNPYQTGKQMLRRNKLSRFVTQSQLSR